MYTANWPHLTLEYYLTNMRCSSVHFGSEYEISPPTERLSGMAQRHDDCLTMNLRCRTPERFK